MNKIKFSAIGYWDKENMRPEDSPTPQQWEVVETISNNLNSKYQYHSGCLAHPDRVHIMLIYLRNGFLEMDIEKPSMCFCPKITGELIAIRQTEIDLFNSLNRH